MSSSSSPSLSTTASDSSSSPTSTSDGNNNNGGFSPPSSTLYLLTFLATLFVLLFVSCAIVLRSFLIRRRFRRQVEEQIAAGLLPPEAAFNIGRRDVGEKPKLWDVSVEPTQIVGKWDFMSPVSARTIPDPNANNDTQDYPTHSPDSPPRSRLSRLLRRNRSPPEASTDARGLNAPDSLDSSEVQVAVLVAMPTPRKRRDSIPEMVIGVSKLPFRKGDRGT